MLLDKFGGKTMLMKEIYEQHHVGKRYVAKNYKDALSKLETQGKIIANPNKRRKGTFGDDVKVSFL